MGWQAFSVRNFAQFYYVKWDSEHHFFGGPKTTFLGFLAIFEVLKGVPLVWQKRRSKIGPIPHAKFKKLPPFFDPPKKLVERPPRVSELDFRVFIPNFKLVYFGCCPWKIIKKGFYVPIEHFYRFHPFFDKNCIFRVFGITIKIDKFWSPKWYKFA